MKKIIITLALMILTLSSNAINIPRPQDVKLWNSFDMVLAKCGTPKISVTEQGVAVWSYKYNRYTYDIVFNKHGRVIEIRCIGDKNGKIATSNIILGDSVKKVYDIYGWPNQTSNSGSHIKMVYISEHNLRIFIAPDINKKLVVQGIIISSEEMDIG